MNLNLKSFEGVLSAVSKSIIKNVMLPNLKAERT